MRQPHGREHVQAVHLFLAVGVGLEEVAQGSESGVVDQQAQIGRVADSRGGRCERGIVGQIGHQDFRAHVILFADLAGDRLQPVLAAGDQQQIIAAGGQLSRKRRAQTAGGSGNDGQHAS